MSSSTGIPKIGLTFSVPSDVTIDEAWAHAERLWPTVRPEHWRIIETRTWARDADGRWQSHLMRHAARVAYIDPAEIVTD